MYSKEELTNIKYNELLKIGKLLGIKGTRQKVCIGLDTFITINDGKVVQ